MNSILYEQPLNERIRTLLKLESLFIRFDNAAAGTDPWDSHNSIGILIDLLALCARSDLKTEMIKELERLNGALTRLLNRADVDQAMLKGVLGDMERARDQLQSMQGQLALALRDNEFLNAIKQRITVPGGTCSFDLPALHLWLHQPHPIRLATLQGWVHELDLVRSTVDMILKLVRETSVTSLQTAENGVYQRNIDGIGVLQLLRIALPDDSQLFPEVSAGKQRFSIYFRKLDLDGRPAQTTSDVTFFLTTCVL
ncbi:MAG: cell division protein ZapD [Gammaproteobacteria bacterium]|nr:cell division protein ZapD [Gammaproteobacteria bacterium]